MNNCANQLARFDGVARVVADPLRFKKKLRIGEDAYASLRLTKHLRDAWDVGGVAATGAAVAASPAVATTFFASTATKGLLGWIGMGAAAATPMGWVVAAALASGGAYYGVMRLARSYSGSRVETIPKFINSPLDLLAATLLDLVGALAMRVSSIDGAVDDSEKAAIAEHFIAEWGLDEPYVRRALDLLEEESGPKRVKQLARALAEFQTNNPDCNAAEMQSDLMRFLREVAEADGVLDEREELALDAIEAEFRAEQELSFAKASKAATEVAKATASKVAAPFRRFRPAAP